MISCTTFELSEQSDLNVSLLLFLFSGSWPSKRGPIHVFHQQAAILLISKLWLDLLTSSQLLPTRRLFSSQHKHPLFTSLPTGQQTTLFLHVSSFDVHQLIDTSTCSRIYLFFFYPSLTSQTNIMAPKQDPAEYVPPKPLIIPSSFALHSKGSYHMVLTHNSDM